MAFYMSAFTAVLEKKYNTDMLKGTDESLLISSVD
jgi:elongation factor P hydroxylase